MAAPPGHLQGWGSSRRAGTRSPAGGRRRARGGTSRQGEREGAARTRSPATSRVRVAYRCCAASRPPGGRPRRGVWGGGSGAGEVEAAEAGRRRSRPRRGVWGGRSRAGEAEAGGAGLRRRRRPRRGVWDGRSRAAEAEGAGPAAASTRVADRRARARARARRAPLVREAEERARDKRETPGS